MQNISHYDQEHDSLVSRNEIEKYLSVEVIEDLCQHLTDNRQIGCAEKYPAKANKVKGEQQTDDIPSA